MGRFELAVLHEALRQNGDGYGRTLHTALQEREGRTIPMGQVYVALARLESKGYLKSNVGEPTAVRGGRAKTFYSVTGSGEQAFNAELNRMRTLIALSPGAV